MRGGKNYGTDGWLPKRSGGRGTGLSGGGLVKWAAGEGYEKAMDGTFNVQSNVDVRTIATLDRYLLMLGVMPRGTSELVKMVLNGALEEAKSAGVEILGDVEEAVEYLAERGFSVDQFHGRKKRRLGRALQVQQLRVDRGQEETAVAGIRTMLRRDDFEEAAQMAESRYDERWARNRMREIIAEEDIDEHYAGQRAIEEAKAREKELAEQRLIEARDFVIRSQEKPREEPKVDEQTKKTMELVKALMEKGYSSHEATQLAMSELESERKKKYAEMEKNAPRTESVVELVEWFKTQGWSSADARPLALEIIEKRRKEVEKNQRKAEKLAEEAPLELVEASYEELLQIAQDREEQDRKEREEFKRNLFQETTPNEENH